MKSAKNDRPITLILFIIYLVLLSWIILFKMETDFSALPHMRQVNLIPFGASVIVNGRIYFSEILNNLLVFIPVGVYLSMLLPRLSAFRKTALAFGLSLTYETLQYILAVGGSDITDLITNTLGGAAGVLIYALLAKALKKRTCVILNAAAGICTVLLIGLLIILQ